MNNILIFGDSHITPFKNNSYNNYNFNVIKVGGASAQGLLNINSKQRALKKIKKFLKKNNTYFEYIILCFGEVDCNATIWYYKEKYNQTLNQALNRSVNNYFQFIKIYVTPYFNNSQIVLLDPILPTISDIYPQTFGVRKEVKATQKQRTELTDSFSNKIQSLAVNQGYHFISINKILRNKKTNLLNPIYIKNPLDHHLPKKVSFDLWTKQMSSILF